MSSRKVTPKKPTRDEILNCHLESVIARLRNLKNVVLDGEDLARLYILVDLLMSEGATR